MSGEILDRVRAIADSMLTDEGMELVDVEYRREQNGWVLRLYLDKEGGVNLEDCARASREIGRMLDVEDFISAPYTLEVSSPGLTRLLKNEKDFIKYRNRLVKVKTLEPIDRQRNFKGRLLGMVDNLIELEIEGRVVHIPLSNVAKAHLEFEF